jgi:hypothetical protein
MEVKFRNNLWDMITYNLYLLPRSPSYRIFWLVLIGLCGYLGFDTARSPELTTGYAKTVAFLVSFFVSAAIGLGLIVLSQVLLLSSRYLLVPKDRPPECMIRLTRDGLTLSSAASSAEFKWPRVRRIQRTRSHILIFVTNTAAIVVPLRAFRERWQEEGFLESANGLWRENKNERPKEPDGAAAPKE